MCRTRCLLVLVVLCMGLAHSWARVQNISSSADLKNKLTEAGGKLVVIDFMATWCGPCKTIEPKVNEIATEMATAIVVLRVDIDESPDISGEYQIKSPPTFVFLKRSKKIDELQGSDVAALRNAINRLK